MQKLFSLARSSTGRALSGAFAVSLIGKLAQVMLSVLAARLLQPAGFGIFTFALGVGFLGGRMGGLGWPILMNRLIPKYRIEKDWARMRSLVHAAHMVVAAGTVFGAIFCLGLAFWVGRDNELFLALLLAASLMPIMGFRSLYRNLLAALWVPQKGIMVDELLPAVLMVLFLVCLLHTSLSPQVATIGYLLASGIAVLAGAFWIWKKLPSQLSTALTDYSNLRVWMSVALPALIGLSSRLLMNRTDVLMLAPLGSVEDVGYYGAAMRITYVQTAAVVVLSTVITARLSEAFAAGRERQGKRLLFLAFGFALSISMPFGILLVSFDDWIISGLFGDSYLPGGPVLQILAISQIGAAISIPASSFMLMTGRQVRYGQITTLGLVANVLLNAILIPQMGATGAALATCTSILCLATVQLVICAKIIRSRRYEEVRDRT